MPKRPSSSHQLGDKAHGYIRQAFLDEGWAVSDIKSDYGEDILVRIFNKEYSRPLYFFVQAKGCQNISDLLVKKGRFISYPLKTTHIEDWKHFLEPVIFAIWDEKTKIIYWQIIQESIKKYVDNSGQKELKIYIPIENVLNKEGLMRIAVRTSKYFSHFERESGIANAIMSSLEKRFNITIDYDENAEVATITDEKEIHFIFSGKMAQMFEDQARREGFSEDDIHDTLKMQAYALHAFENAILLRDRYYQKDEENDCIYVKDNNGNTIHMISPISDFGVEWERNNELREYMEIFLT